MMYSSPEALARARERIKSGPPAVVTRGNFLWRDVTGRVWTLEDLKDDHLLNIVRFMEGRGDWEFRWDVYEPDARERYRQSYALMLEELERRGLQPLSEPHPDAIERRQRRERQRIEDLHA